MGAILNLVRRSWLLFPLLLLACGGGAEETPAPSPPTPTTAVVAPGEATPTPVVVAPTATPAPTAEEPQYGGILVGGFWLGTATCCSGEWLPTLTKAGLRTSYDDWVYNRFITADTYANEELKGELVEKWSFDPTFTVLTLNLRRGVKWHDGTPFTAEDALYTLTSAMEPPEGYTSTAGTQLRRQVSTFRKADDFTVEIEFRSASNVNMERVIALEVIPAHLDLETLRHTMIGTGPFMLKSYDRDISGNWVRNPDYWDKDEDGRQLPYLDGLRFFDFTDRTILLSALRIGRVRFAPAEMKPVIETQTALLEREVPGIQFDWHSSGGFGPTFKNSPPFNDPKLREAIDLWLDRKAALTIGYPLGGIYDSFMLEQSRGGKWGLPPEEIMARPGYRMVDKTGKLVTSIDELNAKYDELQKDPRDRERAKQLLAEAGYKPGDLTAQVAVISYEVPRGGPVFVAQMKELFGATWNMKAYPSFAEYNRDVYDGRFSINFQALGTPGDPSVVLAGYLNLGITSRVNYGGWLDDPNTAKIQRLYDEQDATFDVAKRRELVWEIQRTILDWRLAISVNSAEGTGAYWPELRNIPDIVQYRHNDKRLHKMWIAQ